MARTELEELHELAAIISDDVAEYRQKRRQKTDALIYAHIAAKQEAPVKRRRRHRDIAALIVVALAATATTSIVAVERHHGQAPIKVHASLKTSNANTNAGIAAAHQLSSEGRTNDIFACEAEFARAVQSPTSGVVPQAETSYLKACAEGG